MCDRTSDPTQHDREASLIERRIEVVRMELALDHARGLHNPPAHGCDGCESAIRPGYGDGSLRPVHPLAALNDPTVPHPFEGRTDRWCTLPGCDRPDRAKVHTDYIVANDAAARLMRRGAHV